jgi:hypothetical protein
MHEDFFQVAIQNISDREIELAQGTTLLQVEVRKCHASDLKVGWNELESSLEETSKKWKELDKENRDDYVFAEYYEVETNDKLELVRKGLSLISPNSISIGPLKINFTDSVHENSDEWYWLRVHERRFVKWFGSSCKYENMLPAIRKDFKEQEFSSDGILCPPTNLSNYRKLEQDELIKLQNEDERVALIKEAMQWE